MSEVWEQPGKERKEQGGVRQRAPITIKGDIWRPFVFIKAVVTL